MDEFFIARHGQSEWNAIRRIQGQHNTSLSRLGQQQSLNLRQALQDQPLTKIYTSSLDRTIQTARPLAEHLQLPIHHSALLNELDFGTLVGKFLAEMDDQDQQTWDWWMADPVRREIPGGESYQDLLERIKAFLVDLSHTAENRTILIVGHLRVNQVLLGCLTGLTLEESIFIQQPNNWLYHLLPDSQIQGGAIPAASGEHILWQPGLLI